MNYGTYKAFQALNKRIDDLALLVAALVTEQSNDDEAKALAAELKAHRVGLQDTIPAPAGPTTP